MNKKARSYLPRFSLDDYETLIDDLRDAGYIFRKVSQLADHTGCKVAFMRHDIDLHIARIDEIAEIEASRNVTATYYVLLTQHYNPLNSDNKRVLRKLCDLGHEIGLHYDLTTYPTNPEQARAHLDWESRILSQIVGEPICTISMHEPHKGRPDLFRQSTKYVHPQDPRYQQDMLYVSDSCRAWRDESLLSCFGPHSPRRLMLTTHPELWLDGTVVDRIKYLEKVLIENGTRQHRDYFDKYVRQVWSNHPAPRLYDEHERQHASTAQNSNSDADLPREPF